MFVVCLLHCSGFLLGFVLFGVVCLGCLFGVLTIVVLGLFACGRFVLIVLVDFVIAILACLS